RKSSAARSRLETPGAGAASGPAQTAGSAIPSVAEGATDAAGEDEPGAAFEAAPAARRGRSPSASRAGFIADPYRIFRPQPRARWQRGGACRAVGPAFA